MISKELQIESGCVSDDGTFDYDKFKNLILESGDEKCIEAFKKVMPLHDDHYRKLKIFRDGWRKGEREMMYTADNIKNMNIDGTWAEVETDDGKFHACYVNTNMPDLAEEVLNIINGKSEDILRRKLDEAEAILKEAGVDYKIIEPIRHIPNWTNLVRTNSRDL